VVTISPDSRRFYLRPNPKFVQACFGNATVKVAGADCEICRAGLLLLFGNARLTKADFAKDSPVLREVLALLRLEAVESEDSEALNALCSALGIGWAVDAPVMPMHVAHLERLVELEEALCEQDVSKALSGTAAYRAGNSASIVSAFFSAARARPSRAPLLGAALAQFCAEVPGAIEELSAMPVKAVGHIGLWLALNAAGIGLDRAARLDDEVRAFKAAWRDRYGERQSKALAFLASDKLEDFRSEIFARANPDINEKLIVARYGGDVLQISPVEADGGSAESLLALAAQFGAVECARFLLSNEATVDRQVVLNAFRGGNPELMRTMLDRSPETDVLALVGAAISGWNIRGLRWLLGQVVARLSPDEVRAIFTESCQAESFAAAAALCAFSPGVAALVAREATGNAVVARVLREGITALSAGPAQRRVLCEALDLSRPGLLATIGTEAYIITASPGTTSPDAIVSGRMGYRLAPQNAAQFFGGGPAGFAGAFQAGGHRGMGYRAGYGGGYGGGYRGGYGGQGYDAEFRAPVGGWVTVDFRRAELAPVVFSVTFSSHADRQFCSELHLDLSDDGVDWIEAGYLNMIGTQGAVSTGKAVPGVVGRHLRVRGVSQRGDWGLFTLEIFGTLVSL
jgi:hypothetical protein